MFRARSDFRRLNNVLRNLRKAQAGKTDGFGDGAFSDALKQWATRYSRYIRRRWISGGDGGWDPLAPSTIRGRRGSGKGAKILRDTGVLFGATQIGAQGNLARQSRGGGIEFGFEDTGHSGGMTIARLAEIHHEGTSTIPARPILVEPDGATLRGMRNDIKRAIRRSVRR